MHAVGRLVIVPTSKLYYIIHAALGYRSPTSSNTECKPLYQFPLLPKYFTAS